MPDVIDTQTDADGNIIPIRTGLSDAEWEDGDSGSLSSSSFVGGVGG